MNPIEEMFFCFVRTIFYFNLSNYSDGHFSASQDFCQFHVDLVSASTTYVNQLYRRDNGTLKELSTKSCHFA